MRRFGSISCLLLAAALATGADTPGTGVAGAYACRIYCASCHGADGKGEGPLAESLRFHPPDLRSWNTCAPCRRRGSSAMSSRGPAYPQVGGHRRQVRVDRPQDR